MPGFVTDWKHTPASMIASSHYPTKNIRYFQTVVAWMVFVAELRARRFNTYPSTTCNLLYSIILILLLFMTYGAPNVFKASQVPGNVRIQTLKCGFARD